MNCFIQHHLDNLLGLVTDRLNKIAEYFNEQGGLVNVSQLWGGIVGRVIGKALALTIIWSGILLSLLVLLVCNLGVSLFQLGQPVVTKALNRATTIELKGLNQIGENLNKVYKSPR